MKASKGHVDRGEVVTDNPKKLAALAKKIDQEICHEVQNVHAAQSANGHTSRLMFFGRRLFFGNT